MSKPTYKELEKRIKELEKVNESLIDNEMFWTVLTKYSRDFIAIIDEKGLIYYINKASPPNNPKKMIGNSVYNFMEGEHLNIFKKTLQKVLKTGSEGNYEIQVKGANGYRWHNADVIPLKVNSKVTRAILVSTDVTERKQEEDERGILLHDIEKRVKELNCLYEFSKLTEKPGISIEEILEGAVNLIPVGWQYPKITCGRIILNGIEYKTDNFKCTKWKLLSDIKVYDKKNGTIEVYYLKKMPDLYEGPFLKEERNLIDSLAGRLGRIAERIHANTELVYVQDKLSRFMESATEGFVLLNSDLNLVMINKTALKIIKQKRKNVIGKNLLEISPGLKDSDRLKKYQHVLKTGKSLIIEEKIAMSGVGVAYLKLNVFKVGNGLGYTISDITQRKKTEMELKARETFYAMLIDSTTDGYFDHNLITDEVYYGKKCEELLGYKPGKIKHHLSSWQSLLNPEDIPGIQKKVKELVEGKSEQFVDEYRFRNKTKDWKWLLSRAKIVEWDERGKPTRLVGTHQEITNRKNVEVVMRRYQHIVSTTNDHMSFIDRNYVYLAVNDAYLHAHKKTQEEIIGHSVDDIFTEDSLKQIIKEKLDRCLAGEEINFQLWFDFPALGKRYMNVTYYPYIEIDKSISGIIVSSHDLTERRTTEKALQTTKDLLERTSQMAKVGGWEKNLKTGEDNWSKITREIHEVEPDFMPTMENSIEFYKEGESRKKIKEAVTHTIKTGDPFDIEVQLVTAKGNERWVRAIGNVEFKDREGSRLFGTFQDVTERKKRDIIQEKNLAILNETGRIAKIGGWELNVETGIPTWTDETFRIFEIDITENREPALPQGLDFYTKESRPIIENAVNRAIKYGESYDLILEIITKNGKHKWVHITGKTLQVAGKTKSIGGIIQDITKRKKAEEALKKSEEKFRSLVETSSDMIWEVNSLGVFTYVSPKVKEMWGYTQKETLGKTPLDFVLPEEVERMSKIIQREMKLAKPFTSYQYRYQHKDGRQIVIETSGTPVLDQKGNLKGYRGVNRDITERKRAEESLKASEFFLQESQRVSKLGSYIYDIVNDSMSWTETIDDIFGIKENIKKDVNMWIEYLHPEDRAGLTEYFMKEVLEKGNSFDKEYRIINQKNGKIIWVHGLGELEFDENNNPIKMIGTIQDITEGKLLEEQLQIRQRMDSLGTLAGGIAHDFNNILAAIMGNIDLITLNTINFTQDQKECLKEAKQGSIRAAKLIGQFQTLSTGAVREKTAIDIHDISEEVFNLMKETTNRIISKRIEFPKGQFYVTADSGELHQIMLNLATNSAQAIEERGAKKGDFITIKAEDYRVTQTDGMGLAEGDYVHISFTDNGVGMSKNVRQKAFDPMFTTKDKGIKKGQGLGLAMVYNIVTRVYNGHIYIDSKEKKGTTFHIYLAKVQPKVRTEKKSGIDIIGGTETIMVVDDEENIRNLTKKLLTQIGYTVVTADNGKNALKIYKNKTKSIDLIILDLTMPQMSGQKVFQKMFDIDSEVKVIISSGHGDEFSKKGILAKAKGNISKPYMMKDLAHLVRSVLNS